MSGINFENTGHRDTHFSHYAGDHRDRWIQVDWELAWVLLERSWVSVRNAQTCLDRSIKPREERNHARTENRRTRRFLVSGIRRRTSSLDPLRPVQGGVSKSIIQKLRNMTIRERRTSGIHQEGRRNFHIDESATGDPLPEIDIERGVIDEDREARVHCQETIKEPRDAALGFDLKSRRSDRGS